jgi:hypothetical protein
MSGIIRCFVLYHFVGYYIKYKHRKQIINISETMAAA